MGVQLLRNTRLWVTTAGKQPDGSFATPQAANTWEVLIQDDFSFNQDGNTTDITLNEAGPKPTRGSARYNDSLNPADWSFSTYLRPYEDSTQSVVLTPDYALWHSLASGSPLDLSNEEGVEANSTNMLVRFTDNQFHELNSVTLYYLVDTQWYRIEEVQINQAEISIDIDGIGLTNWTGQGTRITPLGTNAPFAHTTPDFTLSDEICIGASYIRNKLTTLYVRDNEDLSTYNIPITGGTITINNNITYLTPSTLSKLDIPIGSFTGSFEVTGSLEAYLRTRDTGDTQDAAAELLAKLITARDITNSFTIGIEMGGRSSAGQPGVVAVMPRAHVSIPTTETADVLGTTIEFRGIPSNLSAGDEIYLGMAPQYTSDQITSLRQSGDGADSIIALPSISVQPVGGSTTAGDTLTLSVTATGASTYQWYKDGVALAGETASTYTKASADQDDAGSYFVAVINSASDRVDSNVVTVSIA